MEPRGDVPLEKKKAMIEAVRSIPGVTAAGTVNRVPFTGGLRGIPVFPPGTTEFTLNNSVLAPYVFTISPGYLEAAGTRLLRGRDVSWHDTTKTPYVAIVNETFARKMWGDTPAIGQRFILSGPLDGSRGRGRGRQVPQHAGVAAAGGLSVVVAERAGNADFRGAVAAGAERDGGDARTHPEWPGAECADQGAELARCARRALFPARAATAALGVMGLLAAMLAVTGIFGMAAYNVSRRMKELGIRVALGARTKHVMSAAVGRPIVLLGLGSLAGLLLGVFASRLLGQIVYQANPRDPVVLGGAVLTMALLGIAASAIPALRALAVDPSRLMREE